MDISLKTGRRKVPFFAFGLSSSVKDIVSQKRFTVAGGDKNITVELH